MARAAVRADELGAALDGDLADGRGGHDGDGRRHGHHQLARAAQGGVGQQRDRGRVERVLRGHPGQLGVGHALRDEDGADGQAGDDVRRSHARWYPGSHESTGQPRPPRARPAAPSRRPMPIDVPSARNAAQRRSRPA